jgi:hypothetical protein
VFFGVCTFCCCVQQYIKYFLCSYCYNILLQYCTLENDPTMSPPDSTKLVDKPEGPEPEHSCCARVLFVPLSIGALIPAAFFAVMELMTAPIQCLLLVVCKLTICNCCCPDSIHHCFRNVICSPCRWMRISCTGKDKCSNTSSRTYRLMYL